MSDLVVDFHGFTRLVGPRSDDPAPPNLYLRVGPERVESKDDPIAAGRIVEFVRDEHGVYRCAGCVFCHPLGLAANLVTGAVAPRLEAIRQELVELRHGHYDRNKLEDAIRWVHEHCDSVRLAVNELVERLPKKKRTRRKA